MEKLAYALFAPAGQDGNAFRKRLQGAAPALVTAGASQLRLAVVDADVARGAKLRIGRMDPPKAALVTFWLEQCQERAEAEQALASHCDALAGYLVVESRPLVNDAQRAGAGERTPGFSLVSCIEPKAGLGEPEFLRLWYELQRDMAIETQSTFEYVRNEVVRPLTEGAPPWAAIVEEQFPIDALDDPAVFYDAVGETGRLAANQRRMFEAVQQFIALDRIESHPMSQYDLG
jgi:hypothetical protein